MIKSWNKNLCALPLNILVILLSDCINTAGNFFVGEYKRSKPALDGYLLCFFVNPLKTNFFLMSLKR